MSWRPLAVPPVPVVTCQVPGQQGQLVGRQRDLLGHADGVPPAGAAGEGLQGAGQLAAAPQQQPSLLRLLLLGQVLGEGPAQLLEEEKTTQPVSQGSAG